MADEIRNSDEIKNNLGYILANHPDIYAAYENFGKLVHEQGGPLNEKTRWLIKVALSTEGQNKYALRTHIFKALKAGCSETEIEHAILLVAPTGGFPKMMEGILVFREVLGK